MNFKNVKAERTTITRDTKAIEDLGTGNIFESIVVLSKRSNQLSQDLKKELADGRYVRKTNKGNKSTQDTKTSEST